MGVDLAKIPSWTDLMSRDLPAWISLVWGSDGAVTGFRGVFISVIRAVWLPDWAEDQKFADETEQSWAMAMTALSNAWATLEFNSDPAQEFIRLAGCTIAASLRENHSHVHEHGWNERRITSSCRAIFSTRLSKALAQVAQNARNVRLASDISLSNQNALESSRGKRS
jgi:hypothetical protein